jgi:hypothetical protein
MMKNFLNNFVKIPTQQALNYGMLSQENLRPIMPVTYSRKGVWLKSSNLEEYWVFILEA